MAACRIGLPARVAGLDSGAGRRIGPEGARILRDTDAGGVAEAARTHPNVRGAVGCPWSVDQVRLLPPSGLQIAAWRCPGGLHWTPALPVLDARPPPSVNRNFQGWLGAGAAATERDEGRWGDAGAAPGPRRRSVARDGGAARGRRGGGGDGTRRRQRGTPARRRIATPVVAPEVRRASFAGSRSEAPRRGRRVRARWCRRGRGRPRAPMRR
jgi:hypothetical protein